MSASNENALLNNREILKLFYQGGLQKYIPRNESQVYLSNLMNDAVKFCLKDFKTNDPSTGEKACVESFLTKNFQLLNSNLEI